MKKILSLLFAFVILQLNAQLDTEHWFAPMSSPSLQGTPETYLYLSTNETTPFTVEIYGNNTLFTTRQVSKGNPVQVTIPYDMMITSNTSDLFSPSPMGMYVKGQKKFFANFRFGVINHAEIITSKGLAGIGKTFFVGCVPNTAGPYYVNQTIGVLATEDNTTVTLSNYGAGLVFTDGVSTPTRTFTLNKGQSYIIEARPNGSVVNLDGLTGAKIVANKPISVTNGDFTSIYTNNNSSNTDIVMDQAVPTERLGKDFVLAKGNGDTWSGMEAALVIATEPNTTITVNGAQIPGVILNAGQYFIVDGGYYTNQGNNNYNMSLKTSNNAYVYQLIGGTSTGSIYATGGMNFIPPLSCFLPNKVDEIGYINKIGNNTYNTKLSIITQTGATVTVNGANIAAANGPYPVTGNSNWVTYSIMNVSGNITVNSTKAVTAGIAAGNGAVGYGGYFAGFSSVPVIVKTGDCYNGMLLQVDNSYDSYQWYLNGNPIPGATTYSINPELYGAGNYTCTITKNNCETKTTEIYTYVVCPPITEVTYNIGSCNTKVITPAFSNSTQTIVPSQTNIVAQPTQGTATVNTTSGQITYTPNATVTANITDTFVYNIKGNGNPATSEFVRVFVNIHVLQVNNATISSCSAANGNGTYNLTTANVTTEPGATFAYYSDAALTQTIATPASYSAPAGTAYVKVTSQYGCSKTAQITLVVNPSPNINTSNYNATLCDDNFDGTINVDFSTITAQIVTNNASFNVRYYLTSADATAGNNTNLPNLWSYTANTTVYVRVDGIAGNTCPPVFGQINFAIGSKITLISSDVTKNVCDTNSDGTENINLNDYKPLFTADPAVTLTFYSSLANAQNNSSPINAAQTITAAGGVYYIRFQSANGCPQVAKITINLDTINVSNGALSACSTANGNGTFNLTTVNVSTTPGVTLQYYSDAALTALIPVPAAYSSATGTVYVKITNANGCTAVAQIVLTVNPSPSVNTANYNATLCDDNFDGIYQVDFSTVSPQIVANSGNFNIRYYLVQADATAGNNNNLPNIWTYTTATNVYVRVDTNSGPCPAAFGTISFKIGTKIPLQSTDVTVSVCDTNLDGSESVNLNNYITQFTNDATATISFYTSLQNAQNNTAPIANIQVITANQTYYVRIQNATTCPNVAKLNVLFKASEKSNTLNDITICKGQKTILNAGPGYSAYLWNTGATTPTITVGVGNYHVDLSKNGCVYRQYVVVSAATLPTITQIEVIKDKAIIHVTGGTPPYKYSLNGIDYQDSNEFLGLGRGKHEVYVLDRNACEPVIKPFTVLNLVNAITPNSDGRNDILDYSDLDDQKEVSIEIVDRYGYPIFKSKPNQYKWDGMRNNQPVPTGTYWYVIKWIDKDTKIPISYSDWVLVKNRN